MLYSAALRLEDYSDFGSNASGKAALRYDFSDTFALRGSVSTGFRAPSLQQQYFATTSTNFINGIPFDITTFPATDPVAAALGAQPLDAEESANYSIGAVVQTGDLSLTIDAYRINIIDRIVLSENLTSDAVRNFLTARGFIGIGGGRFFINGVDTETTGVDIVASYPVVTESLGKFDLTDIPASRRGTPQVEVTFDIDANGILNVSAKDKATGKEQRIVIKASSGLSEDEIKRMVSDAEAHAEEDKKFRELVETRNKADGMVHSVEQTLKDLGEKVATEERVKVENALNDLKGVLKDDDKDKIEKKLEALMQASSAIAQQAYAQQSGEGGEAAAAAGGAEGSGKDRGDVLDAEFEEVKDKDQDRKAS